MRRKGRPRRQKQGRSGAGRRPGRPGRPKKRAADPFEDESPRPSASKRVRREAEDPLLTKKEKNVVSTVLVVDDGMSEGLHMTTSQVTALGALVACRECGESVRIGVRPTTKGMISEFTVACNVCEDTKSTNTPNLIRERKRKREKKGAVLQKTENINYAHVAAFLDNGLGYSGLRHYCKYFNARCLNEATFIVYARQVISDVVTDTEDSLQYSASIVREVFKSQLETDGLVDITVAFTTTYHQWGSDFCLVAGAVIELTTGLVLDYDVANMYCHVCKINAKKIVNMSPAEMTEWFNKHQDTCEIREWCDELDHDAEEGVREIEPKYLECFIAKKIWSRSIDKFGFRYTTLIHESDEKIHEELSRAAVYEDIPILIDSATSCFSRRKSEHARTSFQTKLKAKCPRERVQTKDRILYVYAMSIPEYNKFAISSNIKLRQLVKQMEGGVAEEAPDMMAGGEEQEGMPNQLEMHEVKAIKQLVAENGEEEEEEEEEEEQTERVIMLDQEGELEEEEDVGHEEQEVDDPEELEEEEEEEGMEQGEDEEELLEEEEALAQQRAEEEERRRLEDEWKDGEDEEEEEETLQQIRKEVERGERVQRARIEEITLPLQIKQENQVHIKEEFMSAAHAEEDDEEEEEEDEEGEEEDEDQPLEERGREDGEEEEEEEDVEEEEDEEELEQLRLEEDDELEEEDQDQMQEEEEEEEEEEEDEPPPPPPPPRPQAPAKQIMKKQEEDTGGRAEDKSKGVKLMEIRQFRKEMVTKTQQEEASRKRKQQEEEEEEGGAAKRSKQEEAAGSTKEDGKQMNSNEGNKQTEMKRKESERSVEGEKKETKQAAERKGPREQAEEKQKVEDKQRPREDRPRGGNEEKQRTDKADSTSTQQRERKEEKQKPDSTKQPEKKEDRPKPDSKPSEGKDIRQKAENKPNQEKKPDKPPSKEKEERSTTEKKEVKTTKSQGEEEAKEREKKDVTKPQREEGSKARVEVTQKAVMPVKQPEKMEPIKQVVVVKRPAEGEGKALVVVAAATTSATKGGDAGNASSPSTKVTTGNTSTTTANATSTATGTDKT